MPLEHFLQDCLCPQICALQNTVYRYSRDEYDAVIAAEPSDWTRDETDQLFELCERFDLRFSIIADRFQVSAGVDRVLALGQEPSCHPLPPRRHHLCDQLPLGYLIETLSVVSHIRCHHLSCCRQALGGTQRSVEDLRERYYSVARRVLSARGDSESNAAANGLARSNFNKYVRRGSKGRRFIGIRDHALLYGGH